MVGSKKNINQKRKGGAQKGNQFGVKLKDPELRQMAYMSYCDWIAEGKSQASFAFKHGEHKCVSKTIESYIKKYPDEFLPIHKEYAIAKGMQKWEKIVEDSACGLNKEANTASLQMLMRNKFGWDKPDKEPVKEDTQLDNHLLILKPVDGEWKKVENGS